MQQLCYELTGRPAKEVNFCCRYRPSVEVAIEKLVQAVTCIVRCLAVVFHPVIKQGHAGLEVRVKESMVRAGIDNELDRRPVVAPAGDSIGAVCRRRPIVEGPDEDERGYLRTCRCQPTCEIVRRGCPVLQEESSRAGGVCRECER